ncbi:MAG TPA: alcohol dehydrogenase catalytic domain-containing protein, partial [Acidimicrobiales bacterium]|nr:alcohol dehydrogenase catalytic domain-containing protein [Acidimicrobiales bacterium]
MRAAVLRGGQMIVRDDVPDPQPGFGQVLVDVKACGICGSDLHFVKHGETMLELGGQMEGIPDIGQARTDLSRDVFMGHEFCGQVLEAGPDTVAPKAGALVTSIPIMISMTGVEPIVYCNDLPGGYSERMLLSAALIQEVP